MTISANSSPLQHSQQNVGQIMRLVLLACMPGVFVATWFFGFGILINILVSAAIAVALEAVLLKIRNRNVRLHLSDNSALVTAVLFGLALPPGSPWWLIAIGIFFAMVFAKHIYGGLGQNPFNPAMCGYVLLLLAFPLEMSNWRIPGGNVTAIEIADGINNLTSSNFLTQIQSTSVLSWGGFQQSILASFPFLASSPQQLQETVDAMSMATPLIEFKMAGHSALIAARESGLDLFARESKTGWELVNIAYLLGGMFLLYRRIISWHIPLAILSSIIILSSLFYTPAAAAVYGSPYLHLFGSATMLGAFFIATDPVSAATSNTGKLMYGVIIGCAIYSIRAWGSYPDSIALAVLFGNFCAPLLDHFLRPRMFGHGQDHPEKNESEIRG